MNRVSPAEAGPYVRALITLQAAIVAACGVSLSPTAPSSSAASPAPATSLSLEAEAGTGDGQVRERSRASGARTVHLGPGERRGWTFKVPAASAGYMVAVTYSNGEEGEQEILRVSLDGAHISTFRDRNSGDAVDGWNQFITDSAGSSQLASGVHTLTLEVDGGDGCVEIDLVTLTPVAQGE